jgi:hypothetical protein
MISVSCKILDNSQTFRIFLSLRMKKGFYHFLWGNLSRSNNIWKRIFFLQHPLLNFFGGRLLLEVIFHLVVFISYLCTLWFDPISLGSSLSKIRPVVAEIFYFLYFEVIFRWRSSSIGYHLHFIHLYTLVDPISLGFKIQPVVADIFYF